MTAQTPPVNSVGIPRAFNELFVPARYKVYWGGRGSTKSWSMARALVMIAHTSRKKIGCFREYQSSIADSVHAVIVVQIELLGLLKYFRITDKAIYSRVTGSEFIFKGLHHNVNEIKSIEGIDIAWVEEAQSTSEDSWQVLVPTIRKESSEIWASFNQRDETDAVYRRFVLKPPPGAIVRAVTWRDNPFFTKVLDDERRYLLDTDPEAYEWIWGTSTRVIGDAVIFKGRYVVEGFATPEFDARFFHGLDFGFSTDPMAFIRSFITKEKDGDHLWIDREAYGHNVELTEYPQFLDQIETARQWPIIADSSRPETISYVKGLGFNCRAAEKWAGSVEDGITHLKGFRKIHVHERCKHMAQEARLYAYKVDRISNDVLPVVVDKNNHCWDGVRYSLDGYIRRRGATIWRRLADKA